jgi:hypothetical protein
VDIEDGKTHPGRGSVGWWDVVARVIGLLCCVAITAAAVAVLQTDASMEAWPPGYGVPAKAYLAVELGGAAAVGLIGVIRGSRPLLGAAGGLILPIGLMSLLVAPAALLIAVCGVLPSRRRPSGRELAAGVLVVLLGLAPFFAPAVLSSPRCWVEIADAAGRRVVFTAGMPAGIPGQTSATCAERVPDPIAFPIAVALVAAALAVSVAIVGRKAGSPGTPD